MKKYSLIMYIMNSQVQLKQLFISQVCLLDPILMEIFRNTLKTETYMQFVIEIVLAQADIKSLAMMSVLMIFIDLLNRKD
jgi:hypothetical protein